MSEKSDSLPTGQENVPEQEGRLSKTRPPGGGVTPNYDAAISYQESQSDPNALDQIRDMIDENNEEGHHCEIPANDTLEAESDNDLVPQKHVKW